MNVELNIRPFEDDDDRAVSELIRRCLVEVNSQDYEREIIARMVQYFSPEKISFLAQGREMFVSELRGELAGTVSRDGNKVYTMFVDIEAGGQGIGSALMSHIEELACREGYDHMETGASITAHDFYRKLGYTDVRMSETDFGLNYILRKSL